MSPGGRPTLVVVSGPAGSGKTRLAHALAAAIPCPAICRDEIKEGMVHAFGEGFEARPGDPLTMRTYDLFFEVLGVLLRAGVTVVAEAAFQDRVWRRGLEPLAAVAQLRIVHCTADAETRRARVSRRLREEPSRRAHADAAHLASLASDEGASAPFERPSIDAPSIVVDTNDGYEPPLSAILAFVGGSVA